LRSIKLWTAAFDSTIRAALTEKPRKPDAMLEHIDEGDDIIAGMFDSEPSTDPTLMKVSSKASSP